MRWPARRFDHFFKLHQRQAVIAGLENQKQQMIAALWSNSNWDDDKGTRRKAIDDIEHNYQEALKRLEFAMNPDAAPKVEEIDYDNPFFAAAKRGMEKLDAKMGNIESMPNYEPDPRFVKYKTDQSETD